MPVITLLITAVLLLTASTAHSWSRAGHMVTAAIAHADLAATNAEVIAQIMEIMARHPDRGTFEVAVGEARGEARAQRMFMQMARWPDDIRSTHFDRPTWHYSSEPLVDERSPPSGTVPSNRAGAAFEAFVLNLKVAGDRNAPPAERAIALCWIFHLVGDMHQPLHAVDFYSARFAQGDRGGGLQFVRADAGSAPMSLHYFWDDLVPGTGEAMDALQTASSRRTMHPRDSYPQLAALASQPTDMPAWTRESADLGRRVAYRTDLVTGTSASEAAILPPMYVADARATGERQLVLSAYRLSDVLRTLFASGN